MSLFSMLFQVPSDFCKMAPSHVMMAVLGLGCQDASIHMFCQEVVRMGVGTVHIFTNCSSKAVLQVLATLLGDPFYDTIRTQQQLGYVVSCFPDKFEGRSGN